MKLFPDARRRVVEGLRLGHSPLDPVVERGVVHGSFGEPRLEVLCHTVDGDVSGARTVSALLDRGSPSAVLRRVRAVVVDAIKGVLAGWATPHVSKKAFVRGPSFTHKNPASTVSGKRLVSWILAPVSCARPYFELSGFLGRLPVRDMRPAEGSHVIDLRAPARRGLPGTKRRSAANRHASTRAHTAPASLAPRGPVRLFNDRQTTKNFPEHVYFCHAGSMTQER